MKLLDANAILMYLTKKIEEQANETEKAINEGCYVTIEVIAECDYVLTGFFGMTREDSAATLRDFCDEVDCFRKPVLTEALELRQRKNLDFVDCVLTAEAKLNKAEIITFDKKLLKAIKEL